VEMELGISGPVKWPWGPKRKGPYPYREHPFNSVAQLFIRGCDRLGIGWAPAPVATISAPKDSRHPCVYRGWCIYGCSTNAKASTLVTYIPRCRVTFSWSENDRKIIEAGMGKEREILEAAGAEVTWQTDDTAHLLGACRMGSDPLNSVVDQWCHSWDVPNLFICDGSVFVTSSAVNPSLTIEAIAARTADYIINRAHTGEL
jgi:choline dehydrogenase-like flavoprotein